MSSDNVPSNAVGWVGLQVKLDAVYGDISAVAIWGRNDYEEVPSTYSNLTLFTSATTDFSAGVKCAENINPVSSKIMTMVVCNQSDSNALYVTLARWIDNKPDWWLRSLSVGEMLVLHRGTNYNSCTDVVDCMLPVKVKNLTDASPSIHPTWSDWTRMFDGQTTYVNINSDKDGFCFGTGTGNYPHVTVELDGADTNITGVSLWNLGGDANLADFKGSLNLDVWLHMTSDFTTDANAVKCASSVQTVSRYELYMHCPTLPNAKYVTVQKMDSNAALYIQEMRVYHKQGELFV